MHTGDLALTWWLLMIAPGLIGAILGFSFTGNARGLVAGAVLGPLAMITLLIFSGSAHAQLRFDDEQQRIYMNLDDCMLNSLQYRKPARPVLCMKSRFRRSAEL